MVKLVEPLQAWLERRKERRMPRGRMPRETRSHVQLPNAKDIVDEADPNMTPGQAAAITQSMNRKLRRGRNWQTVADGDYDEHEWGNDRSSPSWYDVHRW